MSAFPIKNAADVELAAEAAAGLSAAREKLFLDYHGHVFSLCMRYLKTREDAEDMTQDVFIHIYGKIRQFNGSARLKTWIHRLTVNHCLMRIRKNSRYFPPDSLDEKEFCLPVRGTENPRLPITDQRILLKNCIRELPEGQKNVFILHDVRGFEHAEVSRILNLSEGTSKSQLHKARLKMRKLIHKKANPKIKLNPVIF